MNDLQNLFLGALGYFLGMVATTPKLGPEVADRLLTTAEHDGIAGLLAYSEGVGEERDRG